jgi:hypothetical protein
MAASLLGTDDMQMITIILFGVLILLILGTILLHYAVYFMNVPGCSPTGGIMTFSLSSAGPQ